MMRGVDRTFSCSYKNNIINLLSRYNSKCSSNLKEKDRHTSMENDGQKLGPKINFKTLRNHKRNVSIEIVPESTVKKPRGLVDLKLMKEELKQLEDPPVTPWEKQISSNRLPYSFYNVPCKTLAKSMLGKILVRKLENGTILKGKIVETESYLGVEDGASHTYKGKVTPRNIPMYMNPGTIYIYFTYGMYHCFNISSQEEGSAVLLRAIEPLEGIEQMSQHRRLKPGSKKEKQTPKELKTHELCNGPSKLCMAFQLQKKHSKYSMCSWKELWLEDNVINEEIKIVECSRIGIESAGEEWSKMPLRYYIFGHKCVSKRNKSAELPFNISHSN